MKKLLDLSLLSDDDVLPEYSEGLRSRLEPMSETLERANSAVMFAELAEKQSEPWASAAFLRAALADLCSMEETQKIDRPSSPWVKIADEQNPLLHLLVLLRHLNIHVKAMAVESEHSAITLDGLPLFLDNEALIWSVLVVTNLSSSDLAALRNGSKYEPSDLSQSVAWFDKRQRSCGADKLIAQGVAMFATLLCDRHGL